MDKRELLKLMALVSMTGSAATRANSLAGAVNQEDDKKKSQRILVIGAGLAGLAAAQELKRAGHQVLVLEARERIGGRTWTSDKWPDMPLDLGASWIHGVTGNPLTTIADQLAATRRVTRYANAATYNATGQRLSNTEAAQLANIRAQVFTTLRKAQNAEADTSVRQAVALLAEKFAHDPIALHFLNFCLSGEIEHEYAGSANHLSSHWYDSAQQFKGDDVLFAQGFKVIVESLAQGIALKLNHVVKEIWWQESDIRVRTTAGDFVADRLVITLPLGVLQNNDVRFYPDLPADKRNAISQLGMGVLNKCYLRFAHAFWPDDVDWLEYIAANHGQWTEWVSLQRALKVPILLGFNAADYGTEIEDWSDQQIVASAMATLTTIFGAAIPQPIDYQITRWASDAFARGSYSYNALGATPQMREVLARNLNKRVFFAGEATHKDYFGTTHGAYLSGLQVAKDIALA